MSIGSAPLHCLGVVWLLLRVDKSPSSRRHGSWKSRRALTSVRRSTSPGVSLIVQVGSVDILDALTRNVSCRKITLVLPSNSPRRPRVCRNGLGIGVVLAITIVEVGGKGWALVAAVSSSRQSSITWRSNLTRVRARVAWDVEHRVEELLGWWAARQRCIDRERGWLTGRLNDARRRGG